MHKNWNQITWAPFSREGLFSFSSNKHPLNANGCASRVLRRVLAHHPNEVLIGVSGVVGVAEVPAVISAGLDGHGKDGVIDVGLDVQVVRGIKGELHGLVGAWVEEREGNVRVVVVGKAERLGPVEVAASEHVGYPSGLA